MWIQLRIFWIENVNVYRRMSMWPLSRVCFWHCIARAHIHTQSVPHNLKMIMKMETKRIQNEVHSMNRVDRVKPNDFDDFSQITDKRGLVMCCSIQNEQEKKNHFDFCLQNQSNSWIEISRPTTLRVSVHMQTRIQIRMKSVSRIRTSVYDGIHNANRKPLIYCSKMYMWEDS